MFLTIIRICKRQHARCRSKKYVKNMDQFIFQLVSNLSEYFEKIYSQQIDGDRSKVEKQINDLYKTFLMDQWQSISNHDGTTYKEYTNKCFANNYKIQKAGLLTHLSEQIDLCSNSNVSNTDINYKNEYNTYVVLTLLFELNSFLNDLIDC